jgi:thiol-disulfide isomerase/thioredoxin
MYATIALARPANPMIYGKDDSVLLHVTEATFARQILRSQLPVLACFGTRQCPARQALIPSLEQIAISYRGQLLVAMVLVDHAPLLAEQWGVAASPTLLVFHHGERQGQVVGFIPSGLLDLLAEDVAQGAVSGDVRWNPVEAQFEDAVLLPLLHGWGWVVQRQVACVFPKRPRALRGRIDLLVYAKPQGPPLTLIESKRQIRGEPDLRQAVGQAAAYAHSLGLPSFVIAAPRGVWVYRTAGEQPAYVRHFTSLALHQAPEELQQLLLALHATTQ